MKRRGEAPRRIDKPAPGYFSIRLVKGGPEVGARILYEGGWYAAEIDGEMQEPASTNPFEAAKVSYVWERGTPISEDEWQRLVGTAAWARLNAPIRPEAHPDQPIRLEALPSLF